MKYIVISLFFYLSANIAFAQINYVAKAEEQVKTGNYEEAVKLYQLALEQSPQDESIKTKVLLYSQLQDEFKALNNEISMSNPEKATRRLENIKMIEHSNPFIFAKAEQIEVLKKKVGHKKLKQIKIYYDKDWKVVNNESQSEYYSVTTFDENRKPVGITKGYYIAGELQFEGHHSFIDLNDASKNVKEGLCIWYFKNGKKSSEANFSNGKANGLVTWWYDNGSIRSQVNYVNGKASGSYYRLHDNGNKEEEGNFIDGKLNGKVTRYNENGNKTGEGNYIDDKLIGSIIAYDENGKLVSKP